MNTRTMTYRCRGIEIVLGKHRRGASGASVRRATQSVAFRYVWQSIAVFDF